MNKQDILEMLQKSGVPFTAVEHPAVYTIEEMEALGLPHFEAVAKNLFVRDAKKRNYYLLVAPHAGQVTLTDFAHRAGTTRLSFASPEDLQAILGLYPGAVSPFGILNDEQKMVQVYLDQSFAGQMIGVHPNDNTASVFLQSDDLLKMLLAHGNPAQYFPIIHTQEEE